MSTNVKKTADCVRLFVRTSLADIGAGVPPDSEGMGESVKVRNSNCQLSELKQVNGWRTQQYYSKPFFYGISNRA